MTYNRPLPTTLLLLILLLNACDPASDKPDIPDDNDGSSNMVMHSVSYDSVDRIYYLNKPDGLPSNAPLVIFLHGRNMRAVQSTRFFNAVSDTGGFAICYPQGPFNSEYSHHWNLNNLAGTTDDIGFINQLTSELQAEHGFDSSRTYIAGISLGGFMTYNIICEYPELYSGAACIFGSMLDTFIQNYNPSPISVLHIHGTEDESIPINGGYIDYMDIGTIPSAKDVVNFWAGVNQCSTIDTQNIGTKTTSYFYKNCTNGNEVRMYEVEDLGHTWPTKANANFHVGKAIWNFFRSQ